MIFWINTLNCHISHIDTHASFNPYHPQCFLYFKDYLQSEFCKLALQNIHEANMLLQANEQFSIVGPLRKVMSFI